MAQLHIGALVDPASHERTTTALTLPTEDLTTHGVIVGMTGSGKTGLAMVLIEELLGAGVPCLLVDPKGDLGNLLLTFPELAPGDFRPWIDEGAAARAGMDADAYAAQQAAAWRDGLSSWGLGPEQLRAFRERTRLTIYTPGSTSGVPVNLVGSLQAPEDLSDREAVHDEIEGVVSGLLGLVGIAADPLSSREHILLANLLDDAWSQGRPIDLATLVLDITKPPLRKLGVFDLDTFFPEKDRMALAMKLNALLASPAFAAWAEGPPLDVGAMLRAPDGRPSAAIVSTAHLSDDERQFVTSLLLSKLVGWMRRQSGTSDLRALLYMDEVAGYLPPVANPPTKKPVMLLMKQARAFGVGVVLATQNPVDVDYKAISNAGTWMVGRLQTERDKDRLLEGMRAAAGTVDLAAVSATISGLGKREFVLRRAGKDQPEVFTTRWAMSYLRGPLTRHQIARLSADQRAELVPPATPAPTAAPTAAGAAEPAVATPAGAAPGGPRIGAPPRVASGIPVRHLDPAAAWAASVGAVAGGPLLRPAAVARVHLRYDDDRAGLRHDEEYEAVLWPLPASPDATGAQAVDYDDRDLLADAPPGVDYAPVEAPIGQRTYWTSLQRGLIDHLVRTRTVQVPANRTLKLYGRVGESQEAFRARCHEAADAAADEAAARLRARYEQRLQRAKEAATAAAIAAQQAAADRDELATEGLASTVGDLLTGFLGGRRRSRSLASQAATRQRRAATAANRADAARDKHAAKVESLRDIEADLAEDLTELHTAWDAKAGDVSVLDVPLEKSDVSVSQLVLVWVPGHQ